MNSDLRSHLTALLAQEGPTLLQDPARTGALLRERAGDSPEINMLVNAQRIGVPQAIHTAGGLFAVDSDALVAKLQNEMGFSEEAARSTVQTWGLALSGMGTAPSATPAAPEPVPYVPPVAPEIPAPSVTAPTAAIPPMAGPVQSAPAMPPVPTPAPAMPPVSSAPSQPPMQGPAPQMPPAPGSQPYAPQANPYGPRPGAPGVPPGSYQQGPPPSKGVGKGVIIAISAGVLGLLLVGGLVWWMFGKAKNALATLPTTTGTPIGVGTTGTAGTTGTPDAGGTAGTVASGTPYDDPLTGLSFTPPAGWEQKTYDGKPAWVSPETVENFHPNLAYTSGNQAGLTTDQAIQSVNEAYKSKPSIVVQDQKDDTVNGNPAHMWTLQNTTDKGEKLTQIQVLVIKDGKFGVFTFTAPPNDMPNRMNVIKSTVESAKFP